jgi:MscS family membrane protein
MEAIKQFFASLDLDVTATDVMIALVAIVAAWVAGRIAARILRKIAEATPEGSFRRVIVEAFELPVVWALRTAGIWFALNQMPLGKVDAFDLDYFVDRLMQAVTIVLATWLGTRIIDSLTQIWERRAAETEGRFDDQLVPVARASGKVTVVVIGLVMALQQLDYSVSSLLAGLGIGGAAVAFASKDTVANFFGSIVIFVDRPFQVGDWIEVGDVEGTVEEVGLRVTRIRTFANSLITIPNAKFTTDSINNWAQMKKRRVKMTIGLTYDTTPEKMRQAVKSIREIIKGDDRFHHDFYLVNFFDFGDSSLGIFCYFFTRTTNWAEHMQIREDFMLKVMDSMRSLGLSFAFPTQTVHLEGLPRGLSGGAAANTKPEPPGAPKAMLRETPI